MGSDQIKGPIRREARLNPYHSVTRAHILKHLINKAGLVFQANPMLEQTVERQARDRLNIWRSKNQRR